MESTQLEEVLHSSSDSDKLALHNFELKLRKRYNNVRAFIQSTWPSHRSLAEKSKSYQTVEFHLLPAWLQYNEFLRRGHRPPTPSLAKCLKSIFNLHTETFNIWTHLLPCIGFIIIFIIEIFSPFSELSLVGRLAFVPYLLGLIICYGLSALYHTLVCHSPSICKIACACDYLGIISAMFGFAVSGLFYAWWCRWHWTLVYFCFYTVLSVVLSALVIRGSFYGKGKGNIRALVGVLVLVSAGLCISHLMLVHGFSHVMENWPIKRIGFALVTLGFSAIVYASKFPEKLWPGKFDIVFQSHQIFHVLVVAATSLYYHCLKEMARYRAEDLDSVRCSENYVYL